MSEGFGGIKDVLLLGRQALFNKSFFKASNNFARAAGSSQVLSMGPRYIMELVAFSSVILLVIFLLLNYQGNIGTILPMITIYALAGFKLLPAFQQIYYSLTTIRVNIHAFHVLQEDLEISDADYLKNQLTQNFDDTVLDFKKNIKLQNIKFKYPHAFDNALNNINLEIPVNNVIGIVGSSGSGKSTLIDILLGLISPDEGKILIDGKEINSHNIKHWQNLIGFVPQSIFLADSTIKENIAFGLPEDEIDDQQVANAIDMSHLREFVDSLHNGINTVVGERGVQLSGGQRQRIGIARALYQNASVLILDEATSSLDGISEMLIMNAINDFFGKKTIVIIAHRLSTIKNCNTIYILENGKILDSGTYDQLKEQNQFFKKMLSPDGKVLN
jgi:HlyD family secretion protein